MEPKIGVQTIIFGREIHDLKWALDLIKRIGYQGVEFAQHPETLGDPRKLEQMLKERGLTLLGLTGGTLEERIRFCAKLSTKPLYLKVQEWDLNSAPKAIEAGYTLGLHPHHSTPINRLSRALPLLAAHKELKFIPDTAHLWLAGDDVLEVLKKTEDRLIAVHLKDWRLGYGRSFATFSRGFAELGCGKVPLGPVWEWLKENFKGWVVVEQDTTGRTAEDSLSISWNWLDGRPPCERECKTGLLQPDPVPPASPPLPSLLRQADKKVIAIDGLIRDSQLGLERFYRTVLGVFTQLVPCECASLWEVAPPGERMILQAMWPEGKAELQMNKTLSAEDPTLGKAIRARALCVISGIHQMAKAGQVENPEFIAGLKTDTVVSIPILNTFNMNLPELLVNLFPCEWPAETGEEELKDIAKHVAVCVEWAWEGLRGQVIEGLNYSAGGCATVRELLDVTLTRVRIHTRAQAASIFLIDPAGLRLKLEATTGLEGETGDVSYKRDEGLPGKVWASGEPLLTKHASSKESDDPRPKERVDTKTESLCLIPVRDPEGEIIGVMRCRGKVDEEGVDSQLFSATDVTMLEGILEALSPRLVRMQANEWRARAITRITHELKNPIDVTTGAVEFMKEEMRKKGWVFSEDYVGDIEGYTDLMRQLVGRASFLRPGVGLSLNRSRPILPLGDIVEPAVRQARMLLEPRGFSGDHIGRVGVKDLPRLYLDKARFQQVIWNLLNNAIKYAYKDPSAFQVEILGRDLGRQGFEIVFRDWGPGVPEELKEAIFEEGVRGPNAYQHNIGGDGIGCWMIREIVEAHGGRVRVTNCVQPTEFTISLPMSMKFPPSGD